MITVPLRPMPLPRCKALARVALRPLLGGPRSPVQLGDDLMGDWRNGLAWAEAQGFAYAQRLSEGDWIWTLTPAGGRFLGVPPSRQDAQGLLDEHDRRRDERAAKAQARRGMVGSRR